MKQLLPLFLHLLKDEFPQVILVIYNTNTQTNKPGHAALYLVQVLC